MASVRPRRVGDQLREVISELLLREAGDPRLARVHVTEVRVSPDLRQATVFVSLFPASAEERTEAMRVLGRAAGFFRREIGRRTRLRQSPALHFVLDRTAERSAHIEEVLRDLGLGGAAVRKEEEEE